MARADLDATVQLEYSRATLSMSVRRAVDLRVDREQAGEIFANPTSPNAYTVIFRAQESVCLPLTMTHTTPRGCRTRSAKMLKNHMKVFLFLRLLFGEQTRCSLRTSIGVQDASDSKIERIHCL